MQNQLAVLTGYVESLPRRTRAIAAGMAVIVVLLAVGLAYYLRGDDSALFPRALDADQLTEVEGRLTDWDVPFKPLQDNVAVDPARKRDVLLRLALVGIPHPHLATSAETLKDVNALTPDSVLDAQEREGLEGDLSEGLRGISGVVDAHVLIAPAQRGFFVDEASHDTSASVRLTLDQGVILSPEAVGGMRSYVAGAVAGLTPEHVSIVDQTGADLTAHAAADGTEDKGLEHTLQAMLDATVGQGETFVLAHVETDPVTTTSHEVKHVPLGTQAISTDAEREHYVGKNKHYDKVRQNVDRGSDTIERNTRVDAGSTKRRSVAVFVDDRQAAMIPKISDVVGAAAGIVTARGDTLVVQAIHFANAPAAAAVTPPPMLAALGLPLPLVVLGLVSLLALGFIGKPLWESIAEHRESANVAAKRLAFDEFEPVRVHASLREEPPHTAAAILASLPSPTTAAVLEMYGTEERREIVKRLTKQVSPIVRDVSSQAGRV
jgi:flagellar biosynthesis/type III secretory pathway M-ring protein FliF/YscJ